MSQFLKTSPPVLTTCLLGILQGVENDFCAGAVDNADDIALEVMDVGEFQGSGAVIPFQDTALFAV